MASITVKPPLWVPGRNPDAASLWRGCVGYWPLWEGAGDRAFDISGHGNHGVLASMDPPTDWMATPYGCALDFDGANDRVLCGDIDLMDGQSQLSLFTLFSATTPGTWDSICAKVTDGDNRFAITIGDPATDLYFFVANGGNAYGYTDENLLSAGQWYSVVMVFDGIQADNEGRLRAWVNGFERTLTYVGTIPATTHAGSAEYRLSGTAADLIGKIGSSVVWNRALDAGEIAILSADPSFMIRPPSLLPIYAGAISWPTPDYYYREHLALGAA